MVGVVGSSPIAPTNFFIGNIGFVTRGRDRAGFYRLLAGTAPVAGAALPFSTVSG